MEPVVISDGRRGLILSDAAPATDPAARPAHLSVTVEGPGLQASRQVYDSNGEGLSGLVRYFAALATSWRGWTGSRDYESTEGDLRIRATHDGHVKLRVLLAESSTPEGWRVEVEVRLEAGEALQAAAAQIAELARTRLP